MSASFNLTKWLCGDIGIKKGKEQGEQVGVGGGGGIAAHTYSQGYTIGILLLPTYTDCTIVKLLRPKRFSKKSFKWQKSNCEVVRSMACSAERKARSGKL